MSHITFNYEAGQLSEEVSVPLLVTLDTAKLDHDECIIGPEQILSIESEEEGTLHKYSELTPLDRLGLDAASVTRLEEFWCEYLDQKEAW